MKTDAHWGKTGKRPHHGICIPLFSLRTQNSCGIGEFLDLIPLLNWCKEIGFDVIQLLPINDTGDEPSPYNPLSSCALDPIYLSLSELGIDFPFLPNGPLFRSKVLQVKMELLVHFFENRFEKTDGYQTFVDENSWLEPYVRFKALKEQFGGRPWQSWPLNAKPDERRVEFYTFLQFHCFAQMEKVRKHAESLNIKIKGDLPILLSPEAADIWAHPHLFRLDIGAGAPPDPYNLQGQNWGFPLFDWDAMRQDGFQWWQKRLKAAGQLYHIYRIDHVVGFFRIWAIPKGKKPTEGSFFPPDPKKWAGHGKNLLEMLIDASPMLPMAEDLGTIPKEVYPILKELGICGTKVIRWERKDSSYIPFDQYEPFSLTTLSTPDMDPLGLWWKNAPSESVPFAAFMNMAYHPILFSKDRLKILHAAHHTSSLFHINLLQEYLALFPELMPVDERINYPGKILPENWTYRFYPSLEDMASHKGLAECCQSILS